MVYNGSYTVVLEQLQSRPIPFNHKRKTLNNLKGTNAVMFVATLHGARFIQWLLNEWSPRSERWLFWTALIAAIPMAYLMLAGLCAIDINSMGCLIANGELFGGK